MAFKSPKKSGFSFFEVTLAVAIFSLMVTSILGLQIQLLERASAVYSRWNAVVALKNFLCESDRKQVLLTADSKQEKKIDFNALTLSFQLKRFAEGTQFFKITDARRVQADARWGLVAGSQQTENLVTFVQVLPHKGEQG